MDTIGGEREGAAGIRNGRKKDPAKQYDEKDAMSLAKIKNTSRLRLVEIQVTKNHRSRRRERRYSNRISLFFLGA